MERLQKVIANAGYCSRRKAEEHIQAGNVKVNGNIVKELGLKVSDKDDIEVEGRMLEKQEKVYYVMNKPRGVISSVSDDKGRPVVTDYLLSAHIKERVFPVGRLDYDTSGVLLITNDGELANLLMHPKNKIDKVYLVRCEGHITSPALMRLRKGVEFSGHKSAPAQVELLSNDRTNNSSQVRITIHEGRYHQVKEMFLAVGHPVKKLRRERYAFIDVEGLGLGEFRKLKIHEVKQLYALAQFGKVTTNLTF